MKNTLTFLRAFFSKTAVAIFLVLLLSCNKEKVPGNTSQNPGSVYSLKTKAVDLSAHCKGYYEYLPEGYTSDAANIKYPLLIFFHGGGEIGNDSNSLYLTLKNGPLKFVSNGSFPTSFTVGGKTYKFIILAPQFNSSENSYPDEVDKIIEYAKQNYKVDVSRIYLTGLSFGAGLCWNYVGKNGNYARKVAAMVPIASYINEARDEFRINNGKAQVIAASSLPIWSTHNSNDDTCPLSWEVNAHNTVKTNNPQMKPLPRLTVFNAYGHEGWTKTYDPSFKENNQNIYEWLLQYHR